MTTCRIPAGCIRVYTFRSHASTCFNSSASDPAADFSSVPGLGPLPARAKDLLCTSLFLPALQTSVLYTEIDAHTSPFVARTPSRSPWYPMEDVRIHVLTVLVQPSRVSVRTNANVGTGAAAAGDGGEANNNGAVADGGVAAGNVEEMGPRPPPGPGASFLVMVRNRVLLKYADVQRDGISGEHPNGPGQTDVPWEEWGPRNTRWLQEHSSNAWLR